MTFKYPIDGDFFESLGNGDTIIYSRTDEVEQCFNEQSRHSILITHNCDRNVDESLYQKFKQCGKYDIWYAQNVDCKHEDLICIPIGLERKRWCNFNKFDVIQRCKKNYTGHPNKLLYANFSIGTKPDKRLECLQYFYNKEYVTNKVKNYVQNVDSLTEREYEQYCQDILDHQFVLCPQGNGIDTHRLWETLYLGRIPVVLHNHVNDSFADLPILILDKWMDFENEYPKFIEEKIGRHDYSLEKLSFDYWKRTILNV